MRPVFLIVDEMHPSITPMLNDIGWNAEYKPTITRNELLECIHLYQGIIIRSKTPLDASLLERATNLKVIARAGAGLDQIDLDFVQRRNIHLVNAPEGNRDALAEHALGMTLSLLNHIKRSYQQLKSGIWDREANRGHELAGKTVGLIGYGFMGKAFAQKLHLMGCTVLAYDKYLQAYSDEYATEATMDQLYEQSDLLSIHVPLTPETRKFYDLSFFAPFKKPIWLINTSRGEVIENEVVLTLLEQGRILGAALDVVEVERFDKMTDDQKETFNALLSNDKVLITPHVAGWSIESYIRINEVLCEKIAALGINS